MCHGLLIQQEQFDKIKTRINIEYPKTLRNKLKISEGTAKSPVSGEIMKVFEIDGVQIDICITSNYIDWIMGSWRRS